MKKTIATLGAVAILGAGGVVVADERINPYTDLQTHYELDIKAEIEQGERVEISKDEPRMTLKGWNDEYAISIEPIFKGGVKPTGNRPLLSDRVQYKSGDVTAFIEPKSDTDFDIDFTLDVKPDTNVFEYKIEGAEEFDFFYQPELTAEEIAEGASMPDNVVGSYAVYHKTKVNNCTNCGHALYATGKVMHIYRPKAIDANGAETWAELSYENGVLSVTVPQKFLDEAVFPVRVDPTFGYTSAGATSQNSGSTSDLYDGTHSRLGAAGTVDSISFYAKVASAGSVNFKGALYLVSDASLVSSGTEVSVNSTTPQWWISTGPSVSITAQNYYIVYGADNTAQAVLTYYDTEASSNRPSDTFTYSTFPATARLISSARIFSIYATYTASASTPTPHIIIPSATRVIIPSGTRIIAP